jgi:hypothetical protein
VAFNILNPIEFARFLHGKNFPDGLKRDLLSAKVRLKPAEKTDFVGQAVERVMQKFWQALSEK